MRILGSVLLAVLVLALASGCGGGAGNGDTARLKGRITIDGQELPADAEGYIQFMTTEPGQAPPAATDITGTTYEASEVPLGPLNVIFNITRLTGKMVREDNAPGATPFPERENLVPPEHRSGLRIEITGDSDAFDFQL